MRRYIDFQNLEHVAVQAACKQCILFCRMFVLHVSFIFATGTQQSSFGYVLIVVSLNNEN